MKQFATQVTVTTVAVMMLVFGAATIAQAQDQKPEEKPPSQEKKEAKPATQPRESGHQNEKPTPNHAKDNQQAQPESRRAQQSSQQAQKDQAHRAQTQSKQTQENAKRAQKDNAKRASDNARIAQTEQPQRAARAGQPERGRIPDDKFRAHFGREHHFHVGHPVIVDNQPRFQYSGYWFEFADAWPAGWSYDDDCYIDYVDDGYYLFDPVHPGIRIAVTIIG